MEPSTTTSDRYLVSFGAYDGNLFGVHLKVKKTTYQPDDDAAPGDKGFFSKFKFAFKAMEGSIRCVASNGRFLAIGGFDEVLKLFSIQRSAYVEVGELVDHGGTIRCLEFFRNDYLLSGSEDGEIFLWRVKGWDLVHRLRDKKSGAVVSMAVHPSGKLCLAVYASSHMVLWDLTKGKSKLKKKVKDEGTPGQANALVKWDRLGTHYLVLLSRSVAVFSITDDKPVCVIAFDGKVVDFDFIDRRTVELVTAGSDDGSSVSNAESSGLDDVLVVAGEKHSLHYITNWRSNTPDVHTMTTTLGRLRKLVVTNLAPPAAADATTGQTLDDPSLHEGLVSVLNSDGVVSFMKASDLVVQVTLADNDDSGVESESDDRNADIARKQNGPPVLYFAKQIELNSRVLSLAVNTISRNAPDSAAGPSEQTKSKSKKKRKATTPAGSSEKKRKLVE